MNIKVINNIVNKLENVLLRDSPGKAAQMLCQEKENKQ